jgi:acetate kinase
VLTPDRAAAVAWEAQDVNEGTPGSAATVDATFKAAGASHHFHSSQRLATVPALATGHYVGERAVKVVLAPDGRITAAWTAFANGRFVVRAADLSDFRFVRAQSVSDPNVDAVLADLDALTPLAPLHQPQALAAIRAVRAHWPGVPQVASFDTAFHRTRPDLAQMFALPRELHEGGVRRYGFHGLSYEAIAAALPRVAPEIADGRVVIAHLGNGASLCGVRARRSVDTTMSFSALDGLPMGTRVGDLDPAVVLYLLSARGMSAAEIERLLYTRSGLLGVSGVSGDVRELLASDAPHARLALDYFAYRIARETGALAASLGGLDAFVFTAGIGERAAPVRASVCERLAWLGVRLDDAANVRHGPRISAADSRVAIYVIPTDEEGVIARETLAALRRSSPRSAPGRRV